MGRVEALSNDFSKELIDLKEKYPNEITPLNMVFRSTHLQQHRSCDSLQ